MLAERPPPLLVTTGQGSARTILLRPLAQGVASLRGRPSSLWAIARDCVTRSLCAFVYVAAFVPVADRPLLSLHFPVHDMSSLHFASRCKPSKQESDWQRRSTIGGPRASRFTTCARAMPATSFPTMLWMQEPPRPRLMLFRQQRGQMMF